MTSKTNQSDGILRRTVLKAGAIAAGAFALSGPASADEEWRQPPSESDDDDMDEPVGFSGEVLAEHAAFADELAASFTLTYAEGEMGTHEITMDDASNVVVVKLMWEPGGTSGWHTHPGPVIWSVVEGELHVENEDDRVVRTYVAGDVGVSRGQGNNHNVTNASDTEPTTTYAMFFGVPDGGDITEWVPVPDGEPEDVDLGPIR